MLLEVEVKLRLDGTSARALAVRLEALGAPLGNAELQEDTLFAHPVHDFVGRGEALRLRRQGALLELTHKGPREDGPLKARRETTVHLADDPTALLEALGFMAALRLRKLRRTATLAPGAHPGLPAGPVGNEFPIGKAVAVGKALAGGSVEICLDEVEGLGTFVEVEAMAGDAAEGRARVAWARSLLGLERAAEEPRSYAELLATKA